MSLLEPRVRSAPGAAEEAAGTTDGAGPAPLRGRRSPALLLQLGAVGAALAAPAIARRIGRRTTSARAAAVTAGALVVGANAITAWAERRAPFDRDWLRARPGELRTDTTYLVAQAPAIGVANSAIVAGIAAATGLRTKREPATLWPTTAPLPVRLATALVVTELSHYWWHRLGHAAGWRWHRVHHSPERLYWLNATKFHAIDMVVDSVLLTVPLLALGADADALLAYSVFSGTYGKIQHANVAGDSGFLNHVLSTPDLHRWHHSVDAAEGDRNFGSKVILWDQVFGTYLLPLRSFDAEIGVRDAPAVPPTWSGQAALPFRRA